MTHELDYKNLLEVARAGLRARTIDHSCVASVSEDCSMCDDLDAFENEFQPAVVEQLLVMVMEQDRLLSDFAPTTQPNPAHYHRHPDKTYTLCDCND